MLDALLTHGPELLPGALMALVLGAVLGSARVLRPAAMERVSEVLGAEDPMVGILLWALAAIGLLWLGYEASLRFAASSDPDAARLSVQAMAVAGLGGVALGETLRARHEGTASPVPRALGRLFDPSALLDLMPGRRVSKRHELRMACAFYLFDTQRADALIRSVLDPHTSPQDRLHAARAFDRMARHALAFDDLLAHGLRPQDAEDARQLVAELAGMARALRCTDPATLADIRLIGGALGLDGPTIRLLIRAHAGISGDWTHRAYTRQSQQGFGGGSRSGFGQRQQRTQSSADPDPRTTHYSTLGLAPGASSADIKRAWRCMAKRYHPDRFAGTEMTASERAAIERRMRDVNAAYEALKT